MISILAIPFSLSFVNHREHVQNERLVRPMLEKLHFNKSVLPVTAEPAVINDQADPKPQAEERHDEPEIPRISLL